LQLYDLMSEIKFNPSKSTQKELFSSSGLKVNLYCLEEGQKLEGCQCKKPTIWYCVGGNGYFYCGSQRISGTFGTLFVCDHHNVCTAKGKNHFVVLEIKGSKRMH